MNKLMFYMISGFFVVSIANCGSSSTSTQENAEDNNANVSITRFGVLNAFQNQSIRIGDEEAVRSGDAYLLATFLSLTEASTLEVIQAKVVMPEDSCVVEEEPDTVESANQLDLETSYVSAGDALVVTSPAGTFVTLEKTVFEGSDSILYDSDVELPNPLPTGLSVDIPGDEFPSFNNVTVPDVALMSGVSPEAGVPFTAETTFVWDAGNDPDALIELTTANIFTDSNPTGLDVTCITQDDGMFSFPAETKALMGSDFSSHGLQLFRFSRNIVRIGDAVLFVTNKSQ